MDIAGYGVCPRVTRIAGQRALRQFERAFTGAGHILCPTLQALPGIDQGDAGQGEGVVRIEFDGGLEKRLGLFDVILADTPQMKVAAYGIVPGVEIFGRFANSALRLR